MEDAESLSELGVIQNESLQKWKDHEKYQKD